MASQTKSLASALRAFLVAVLVLVLPSCRAAGPDMEEDRLVDALVDLHLLDARRELLGEARIHARDSVLEAHGLTEARFSRAMRSYASRPDDFLELYGRVIDRLTDDLGRAELE